jgi:hypothetical protein
MKKWYVIQFASVSVVSFLYAVWNAVLSEYGINLRDDIFAPALVGILVTSGILCLIMALIKEDDEI